LYELTIDNEQLTIMVSLRDSIEILGIAVEIAA